MSSSDSTSCILLWFHKILRNATHKRLSERRRYNLERYQSPAFHLIVHVRRKHLSVFIPQPHNVADGGIPCPNVTSLKHLRTGPNVEFDNLDVLRN